jgi:flavin reductase (DIM6/NTAB) family NADH-FMN oxidoreductase RutF
VCDSARPNVLVSLGLEQPIWERFFTVAPLVVGTYEPDGSYDLAPMHLAMPMGWDYCFGFICTPRHRTYHNAKHKGAFTVSYPRPSQVTDVADVPRVRATRGR